MSCTDPNIGKLIGAYELGILSAEENVQFENHLLECEYCFQSLYQAAPITKLVREEKLDPSTDAKFDIAKGKTPTPFFGRKWAFAAASVLALMIIVYVFVRIQKPGEKTERLRGHDDVSILVLSPVGQVSAVDELRWKPVAGVESYNVKILTENGELVWEGSAKETKIILPESINKILIRGRSYFWLVEAQTEKGDRLKSQLIQFKIRN
jgi:hypothetical protein